MKKTFVGLVLAATAITPISAALAQDRGDRGRAGVERSERGGDRATAQRAQRQSPQRAQRATPQRAQRQAPQRVERQQQRVQRQAPQRTQRAAPQRVQQQAPQRVQRQAPQRVERQQQRVQRQAPQRVERQQRQTSRQREAIQQRQVWPQRVVDQRARQQQAQQQRARQNWNRSWRNDRRFDWQRHRTVNRHIYRAPVYHVPYYGHRYTRFSIGLFLGQPLFHQRYWLSNPWQYRLPPAPHGYQWVRYYNDVLLVDTWTGRVVDVIYDFFW